MDKGSFALQQIHSRKLTRHEALSSPVSVGIRINVLIFAGMHINIFTPNIRDTETQYPVCSVSPMLVRGTATDSRLGSIIFTDATMEAPYTKVGRIEHFYSKASVAVVELSSPLKQGDKIVIRGTTTKVEQTVDSMEVEHKQIPLAQAGQRVGLKVAGRVRENDIVYKVA